MRRVRRLVLAAAAGVILLSGGQWRAARADIIFPVPNSVTARFGITASAHGVVGVEPGGLDLISLNAPPGFTSFSVPSSFVEASQSSGFGTATARAAGSADATFNLIDDVLSIQTSASFHSEAFFSVEPPAGVGVGSGGFTFDMPAIRITEREYEYSFSGQVANSASGDDAHSTSILLFGIRNSELL